MSGSAPAPLPLRVRLPFESEEAFIRKFGANVSPSGIFIPTRSLKPEGTHLRFELVLADGTRLLRGGVVVQDAIEAAPGRRGGMELAFTELDAQSHVVLARILAARRGATEDAQGIGVPSWRRASGPFGSGQPTSTPAQGAPASDLQSHESRFDGASPSKPADDGEGRPFSREAPGDLSRPARAPEEASRAEGEASLATGSATEKASLAEAARPARVGAAASDMHHPDRSVAGATDASERDGDPGPGLEGGVTAARASATSPHEAFSHLNRALETQPDDRYAEEEAARQDAAQLAQTRARAERVETLARASAAEADALVSRIRGATPTTVLAASVDFPEVGIARWKGGHLSLRPSTMMPDSGWALRLLGHRADAPRVLELAATEGRPIEPDPEGFASWRENGEVVKGVGWAARWFERQAHAGEALAGESRPLWVLALPLHAGHRQREAWIAAAARLGFERVQLTSSPIAAAAAYAHGKGFARRRLLILSTGAVGFDAAIVQLTGDDVETLSAAGDPFLGLPELEARLAYAIRQRLRDAGRPVPEPGSAADGALREACASARRALEQSASATLDLDVDPGDGADRSASFVVTREDLDSVSQDLVERQLALVTEVLDEAQLSAAGVDGVLVLGSVERSPLWKQRLSGLLGRELTSADEVDAASVTRGAALIGEAGTRTGRGRRPFNVFEVLSVPLAIAERSGRLRRVLERGTRLPLSKTLSLTVEAGQALSVMLFQGAGTVIADAEPLGAARVHATLPGEVELQIRVDGDGRVQATVEAPGASRGPLSEPPLDPEARASLLSDAPEGTDDDPRGSGLLGGLRRLFRKA